MTEPAAELKRSISLPLLTFYGLGTILGAGIYVLVGEVVAVAGIRAPIAFLVAAVLVVFTAFSYAELSSRFPRSAGEAVYMMEAFHNRRFALIMGLLVILIGLVSSATIVNGFVGYFRVFLEWPPWLIIILLVAALGTLAAWGISESVWVATVVTVLEILGLFLIVWVAGDSLATLPARLPEFTREGITEGVWIGIFAGAFLAFYAFIGFEDMVNVAEEVKEPRRNLPCGILLALVLSSSLYVLVVLVSVLAMPVTELAGQTAPLARVYEYRTGEHPTLISLISLVAVINGALIQIIMASRVLYGLSWQGWLPTIFSRVHPRRRTPLYATALVVVLVLVLALWFPLITLAKATSLVTLVVFALVNLSLIRVKRRDRHPAGAWVVPVWVPVFGFLVSAAFVIYQLVLGA
ncbi:MAG: amino acid permease [Gammaproteobacteria bacterium]|nr:amino acid permease [Gammaproteobacteria bacterium]